MTYVNEIQFENQDAKVKRENKKSCDLTSQSEDK
jgi:hypothetical protein